MRRCDHQADDGSEYRKQHYTGFQERGIIEQARSHTGPQTKMRLSCANCYDHRRETLDHHLTVRNIGITSSIPKPTHH
jgi:hypothetical protein